MLFLLLMFSGSLGGYFSVGDLGGVFCSGIHLVVYFVLES